MQSCRYNESVELDRLQIGNKGNVFQILIRLLLTEYSGPKELPVRRYGNRGSGLWKPPVPPLGIVLGAGGSYHPINNSSYLLGSKFDKLGINLHCRPWRYRFHAWRYPCQGWLPQCESHTRHERCGPVQIQLTDYRLLQVGHTTLRMVTVNRVSLKSDNGALMEMSAVSWHSFPVSRSSNWVICAKWATQYAR